MAVTLATLDAGLDSPDEAKPVVILHGLFGQKKNWSAIVKRLGRGGPVIAADLRNHGDSPWEARMDYEAMAEDVAALIEERFAGGPAAVVGHSMGGKAAMILALERPDLVARLCVVDIAPAPTMSGGLTGYVEAMQAIDLAGLSRRSEVDVALAETVPEPGVRAFLLTNLETGGGTLAWKPNLAGLAAAMPAIEGFPETDDLAPYEGPTLFIAGGESDYLGPQHQAEIDRLFPRAEIETVAGAGHWVHAEKTTEFLDLLSPFLGR